MEKIRTFELDRWSEPDEQHRVRHIGMADAKETFEKLETHLKEKGMLPDEYFLYDVDMRTKARELPDFNFALCVPNFGGSEGIYLDIDLIYCEEDGKQKSLRFVLSDKGLPQEYVVNGRKIIDGESRIVVWRAPIDNDRYRVIWWKQQQLDRANFYPVSVQTYSGKIVVKGKIVSDYVSPVADAVVEYRFTASGEVHVRLRAELGARVWWLPRFGICLPVCPLFEELTYFGRGPGEAYCDRKAAAPVGLYRCPWDEAFYMYDVPQESGSHCDSRFVCLEGENVYLGVSQHAILPEDVKKIIEAADRDDYPPPASF